MTRPTILDQDVVIVPMKADVGMLGAWYRYKNGHHWPDEDPPRDTSDVGAYAAMLAASPHADAWADVRAYVGELEAQIIAAWNSFGGTLAETIEEADELQLVADGGLDEQISALTKQRDTAEVRIAALEARLKEAERVIEPLADAAFSYDPDEDDSESIAWAHDFKIGTLRAARAFMEGSK